jgi:hypothetical protein
MTERLRFRLGLLWPILALFVAGAWLWSSFARGARWTMAVDEARLVVESRGASVRFRYAWQTAGSLTACRSGACRLCLRRAGAVGVVVAADTGQCRSPIDTAASRVVPVAAATGLQFHARLFVAEANRAAVGRLLATGQPLAVETVVVGHRLVPQRIIPASALAQ